MAWVTLRSGINESSFGMASFGVLSENGAMVGVGRLAVLVVWLVRVEGIEGHCSS